MHVFCPREGVEHYPGHFIDRIERKGKRERARKEGNENILVKCKLHTFPIAEQIDDRWGMDNVEEEMPRWHDQRGLCTMKDTPMATASEKSERRYATHRL